LLSFERLMRGLSHVFLIPPLNEAVMRCSEIVSLPFRQRARGFVSPVLRCFEVFLIYVTRTSRFLL
jgi:hypothetical protein